METHRQDSSINRVIHTDRLLLRPPRPDDVDGLWPHVTNPTVTEFLAWEPHPTREFTRSVLESLIAAQKEGSGFHWLLEFQGEISGVISLIDVRRHHRCWSLNRAELAYWLAPSYWNRGFATEGCMAVLKSAFGPLKLHKVVVYHASDNPSSGAVAQRLGFRYVGEEIEAFRKNGVWHNLKHFEMLEREFRSAPEKPE